MKKNNDGRLFKVDGKSRAERKKLFATEAAVLSVIYTAMDLASEQFGSRAVLRLMYSSHRELIFWHLWQQVSPYLHCALHHGL